jgi:AraC-like DNA-binding protein
MKIRFDRLERVADYLARKTESSAFDMGAWSFLKHPSQGQCGFAGCAMGWVAHEKMFRGFKLELAYGPLVGQVPTYYGAKIYGAVAKLFGISESEASDLFGPKLGTTPKDVARDIRSFIRYKKAEVDHAKHNRNR